MKNKSGFIYSVLIIMCLSSCTTILYVNKTLDPEIILDKKPNNVAFVNIFDYTTPVNVKDKNEVSFQAGVMNFIEGLSSFSKDEYFRFSIVDTLKKGTGTGYLTVLFPIDSVRAICSRSNTEMLLALDSMDIFFDWETLVDTDDEGNKSKTKEFYLYTRFYISLYSATGNLVDRSIVDRSSFYKSRPTLSGLITIKPSIAKAKKNIEELAFKAGQDYVAKYYPQSVQEPRTIYISKPFRESYAYIKAGNWEKAIELLEQLAKSSNRKIADRANQNLSVVIEAAWVKKD
jgi:hypothetical protein